MDEIINLTPHAVTVMKNDGSVAFTLPAAEPSKVARVGVTRKTLADVQGVVVTAATLGEIENLPDEQPGVFYVVSALLASAAPQRTDLLTPGELVRNSEGHPVGCRGLNAHANADLSSLTDAILHAFYGE